MRTETILSLDPGLRALGFAVLRGRELVDAGVRPLGTIPVEMRLAAARRWLLTAISAHRPAALVWEAAPNHSVAGHAKLHRFIRWAARVADEDSIETASYSAKTARQHVVGDGWATKNDVANSLTHRFPQLTVYRGFTRKWKESYWHNLFDAVTIAAYHQLITKPPSRSR